MKKIIFILLSVVFLFTACVRTSQETDLPEDGEKENITQELPVEFSLGDVQISVQEATEAVQVEFNDGNTKVILNNKDGKYVVVKYKLKNNEAFDIDIDHSAEIIVTDFDGKAHYGEYYELSTGNENVTIKPGEEKEVSFISDFETDKNPDTVTFKYEGKEYELKWEF